jgi:hypothetical protein
VSNIELEDANEAIGIQQVWDDLVNSLIGRRLSSVAGRIDYNYDNNSITMQNNGDIDTANDRLILNLQYPHAAVADGVMNLHVHWEQVSSNDIEFTTQYRIQSNGSAKETAWTTVISSSVSNSVFPYVSGTINQITKLATVDLTGAGISATVQFRVARTDSTTGDIEAVFVDAHVKRDMVGSRSEYVK